MNQKFIESLYTSEIFISEEKMIDCRKNICPVRVLNSNGRIVEYCIDKKEAQSRIIRRNNALILLGHLPKKYEIVSNNKISEYDERLKPSKYVKPNRKSKSSVR